MDEVRTYLLNADTAFANQQFETALEWYQRVLELTPNDLHALSRAGAICVPLGRFSEALSFFEQAKTLDPENGDNAFNLGNAWFFNRNPAKAFAYYVEAERIGCSEDVVPRVYYQLALLSSMRQDAKSALIYFQKCEDSDPSGMMSMNPDLISEKLKLYLAQQDFDNAEVCAAQLSAVNPTDFKGYMVYYSILMGHGKLDMAEKVLNNAEKYAELNTEDAVNLRLQMAALCISRGEREPENLEEYGKNAISILEECLGMPGLTQELKRQVQMSLAEACMKVDAVDRAIVILDEMLNGKRAVASPVTPVSEVTLSEADIEEMLRQDMELIEEQINVGNLDENMAEEVDVEYDENGNPVRMYDEAVFAFLNEDSSMSTVTENEPDDAAEVYQELPDDEREKAQFLMMSCYLAKDNFAEAQALAAAIKNSENRYYRYYAMYVEALAEMKQRPDAATTVRKYAEVIAFFRNQSFEDASDTLAVVFRARMYAEQGKYTKAEELAELLAEEDRAAVLKYVKECQQ